MKEEKKQKKKKEKKKKKKKIKKREKEELDDRTVKHLEDVSSRKRPRHETSPTVPNEEVEALVPISVSFPYNYVLAPMVGASELAFRLLCRTYGADLCYTPMMSAHAFATDETYRTTEFQTCAEDRPLVCHFSANTPHDFAAAVIAAAPYCDAVDLNLGCPQRTAFVGHFGSYLLDRKDRDLVCRIIRAGVEAAKTTVALNSNQTISICTKIRLLDTIDETVQLCQQIENAGASWIAVHARYRATWDRTGPGARDGAALLDHIAVLKQHIRIPIIANGNVKTFDDVQTNLRETGADAMMSAEGILDNPALFLPRYGIPVPVLVVSSSSSSSSTRNGMDGNNINIKKRRKLEKRLREIKRLIAKPGSKSHDELEKIAKKSSFERSLKDLEEEIHNNINIDSGNLNRTPNEGDPQLSLQQLYSIASDQLALARAYMSFVRQYPVKIRSVVFHIRRMLKDALMQYQCMDALLQCDHVDHVHALLDKLAQYRNHPESFVFDQIKACEQALALEQEQREARKRQDYEARMMRKAKRQGKPLHFYLNVGLAVPTSEALQHYRRLSPSKRLDEWKKRHAQHCMSYHLDPEGCQRGRSCAFLHVDANSFVESDEVAG